MNIQQRIVAQLEQLATKGPKEIEAVVKAPSDSGYIIGVPPVGEMETGVSFNIEDYDRYSLTLKHFEVNVNNLTVTSDETKTYLEQCAACVTERVTYLEEPLMLVELDPIEGVAQLRSELSPIGEQTDPVYWELMIWTTPHPRAKLARYRRQTGEHNRENMIYPATFITLGRLVGDLADCLANGVREPAE